MTAAVDPEEYLARAYNEDIPLSFTVYGPPIEVGRKSISNILQVLYYVYQQQKFLREEYAFLLRDAFAEAPPHRTPLLSSCLYEKLKFAVGEAPAFTVDFSLELAGGGGGDDSGDNENAANVRIKNEIYRRQCQQDLLRYLFGEEEEEEGEGKERGQKAELLYGMRQIPSHAAEYFTHLQEWVDEAAEGTSRRPTPPFILNLLQFASLQEVDETAPGQQAKCFPYRVRHFNYKPFIRHCTPHHISDVLDCVIPPRQLEYYWIDTDRCAAVYEQRKAVLKRMKEIQSVMENNRKEGKEYLNQPREEELRREEALLAAIDLGGEEGVGEVRCLLERPETTVNDRESVLRLEEVLNQELKDSAARGWQQYLRGSKASPAAPPSKTLDPIVIKKGVTRSPAAVQPHPPELNPERTLLQVYLLSEELLRQTTVDLPERGVLLRRLLNEAVLSLEAHRVFTTQNVSEWTKTEILPEDIDPQAAAYPADGQPKSNTTLTNIKNNLEREMEALQQQKAALERRKQSLERYSSERQAAREMKLKQETDFHRSLCERLKNYTETMKEREKERRTSMTGA